MFIKPLPETEVVFLFGKEKMKGDMFGFPFNFNGALKKLPPVILTESLARGNCLILIVIRAELENLIRNSKTSSSE